MNRILLLAALTLFPSKASAELSAGLGIIVQNLGKTTSSPTASKSLMGTTYLPELNLGFRVGTGLWGFSPSLGITLGKKSEDGGQTKRFTHLMLPASFRTGRLLEWRAGPGLQLYTVSGNGGTSVQRNGSSTSTFYFPKYAQTSRLFFLNLGVGVFVRPEIKIDSDLIVSGLFGNRFATSGILRASYVFL